MAPQKRQGTPGLRGTSRPQIAKAHPLRESPWEKSKIGPVKPKRGRVKKEDLLAPETLERKMGSAPSPLAQPQQIPKTQWFVDPNSWETWEKGM